jgi:hypothetical protein
MFFICFVTPLVTKECATRLSGWPYGFWVGAVFFGVSFFVN